MDAIVPLYGHETLKSQLVKRVGHSLPQSLLLHGPAGVGKQRLALFIAQSLLCESNPVPCGRCQQCKYALALVHPDLIWIFPRPRLKDSDAGAAEVKADLAQGSLARAEAHGLYAPPPSQEGIYVATIRFLVQQSVLTPALASRKVFVIGEADRMAQQEGSEFAANAVLKLLEEPPADTWIILTTSAVGSLLPTIRSRVVQVRVPRVRADAVRAFVADPVVSAALDELGLPASSEERVKLAGGAPGHLLSTSVRKGALDEARQLFEASLAGKRIDMIRAAFTQGSQGARGMFSDILDGLTVVLHDRVRASALGGADQDALKASRAVDFVEDAKILAEGNVNPQLIAARLLQDLAGVLA